MVTPSLCISSFGYRGSFTRMMNKMRAGGNCVFHPKFTKIELTHLCFADDLYGFSSGEANLVGTSSECISIIWEFL